MPLFFIMFAIIFIAGYLMYVRKIFKFLCGWWEKRPHGVHSTEFLLFQWVILSFVFAVLSVVLAIFWMPLMTVSTIGEGLGDLSNLNR